MRKFIFFLTALFFLSTYLFAQNSMVGDGFGGQSWYVPHNYQVGAYTGFTVCDTNRQLYAWGSNLYGEFGDGTFNSSVSAIQVPGMTHIKFYSTGYVCAAIKNDNTAWVWGNGFIYNSSTSEDWSGFTNTPVQVITDVKFVDGGISHLAFVKNDGTVWAVGRNFSGQLGDGTTSSIPVTMPVQMTGVTNAVRAVCLGYNLHRTGATIILLNDGTVKITGGQGQFTDSTYTAPATLPGLTNIVDIKGNTYAAYALNVNGEVFSFGKESTQGVLGLGAYTGLLTSPTKITFPSTAAPIVALSANNDGVDCLALDENGKVYGWGGNIWGELGINSIGSRNTPILIDSNVIDIYCGETFCYILKSDSTLWAAGQSSWMNTGSIWMNLSNTRRTVFTQINPTIAPMNLCAPTIHGVVPVKLSNFTCIANNNNAVINWQSAEETNASKYIVEYSSNGRNFQSITSIIAKGISSNYNYIHQQVSGTAFYRLKMMDKDGSFIYSETRAVKFNNKAGITIAPNPSHDIVYLFTKSNSTIKSVQFFSIDGQLVKNITHYSSGQPLPVSNLAKGSYVLKTVSSDNETNYTSFIKY